MRVTDSRIYLFCFNSCWCRFSVADLRSHASNTSTALIRCASTVHVCERECCWASSASASAWTPKTCPVHVLRICTINAFDVAVSVFACACVCVFANKRSADELVWSRVCIVCVVCLWTRVYITQEIPRPPPDDTMPTLWMVLAVVALHLGCAASVHRKEPTVSATLTR